LALGRTTPIAAKRHRVLVQLAGPVTPDGDGGFVPTWIDATPSTLNVSITAPEGSDLERFRADTVVAAASKRVEGDYHPQITTTSRLIFNASILTVVGVTDPEDAHNKLVLLCVEVQR
jgi:head-tail adaptor